MSRQLLPCAVSAPPIDPDVHRRIRLRRLGLRGAVAQVVADLAFGEARERLNWPVAAPVTSLSHEVRR